MIQTDISYLLRNKLFSNICKQFIEKPKLTEWAIKLDKNLESCFDKYDSNIKPRFKLEFCEYMIFLYSHSAKRSLNKLGLNISHLELGNSDKLKLDNLDQVLCEITDRNYRFNLYLNKFEELHKKNPGYKPIKMDDGSYNSWIHRIKSDITNYLIRNSRNINELISLKETNPLYN